MAAAPIPPLSLCRPGLAPDLLAHVAPEAGDVALRRHVAAQHGVSPERIVLFGSEAQALADVAEHLYADAGGHAVCAAPVAPHVFATLRRAGATLHAVAGGADGFDVAALAALLEEGLRPSLVHVAPTVQDPMGAVLGTAAREQLVELAASYRFLLYEDDARRSLVLDGAPPPRLHALAGPEAVICAADLAGALVPDEAAALVLPARLVGPLARRVERRVERPAHGALAALHLHGDLAAALDVARTGLRVRRAALVGALEAALAERAAFATPAGGASLWLRLPGADVATLVVRAPAAGLRIEPGTVCHPDGGARDALRLRFARRRLPSRRGRRAPRGSAQGLPRGAASARRAAERSRRRAGGGRSPTVRRRWPRRGWRRPSSRGSAAPSRRR